MMPHSRYIAGREPPSVADRLLSHPFTVPLAVTSLAVGVQVIIAALTDHAISRALSEIPMVTQLLVGLPLIAGAPASLAGALHLRRSMSRLTAMSVERMGCTALAAGWGAFFAGVALSGNPFGTMTAHIALAVSAGCAARAVALWLSERRVRAKIDTENRLNGE